MLHFSPRFLGEWINLCNLFDTAKKFQGFLINRMFPDGIIMMNGLGHKTRPNHSVLPRV